MIQVQTMIPTFYSNLRKGFRIRLIGALAVVTVVTTIYIKIMEKADTTRATKEAYRNAYLYKNEDGRETRVNHETGEDDVWPNKRNGFKYRVGKQVETKQHIHSKEAAGGVTWGRGAPGREQSPTVGDDSLSGKSSLPEVITLPDVKSLLGDDGMADDGVAKRRGTRPRGEGRETVTGQSTAGRTMEVSGGGRLLDGYGNGSVLVTKNTPAFDNVLRGRIVQEDNLVLRNETVSDGIVAKRAGSKTRVVEREPALGHSPPGKEGNSSMSGGLFEGFGKESPSGAKREPGGDRVLGAKSMLGGDSVLGAKREPVRNSLLGAKSSPGGDSALGAKREPVRNSLLGAKSSPGGDSALVAKREPVRNSLLGAKSAPGGNSVLGAKREPGGNSALGAKSVPGGDRVLGAKSVLDGDRVLGGEMLHVSHGVLKKETIPGGVVRVGAVTGGDKVTGRGTLHGGHGLQRKGIKHRKSLRRGVVSGGDSVAGRAIAPKGSGGLGKRIAPEHEVVLERNNLPVGNSVQGRELLPEDEREIGIVPGDTVPRIVTTVSIAGISSSLPNGRRSTNDKNGVSDELLRDRFPDPWGYSGVDSRSEDVIVPSDDVARKDKRLLVFNTALERLIKEDLVSPVPLGFSRADYPRYESKSWGDRAQGVNSVSGGSRVQSTGGASAESRVQGTKDVSAESQVQGTKDVSAESQVQGTKDVSAESQVQGTKDVSAESQVQGTKDVSAESQVQGTKDVSAESQVQGTKDVSAESQVQGTKDVSAESQVQGTKDVSAESQVKDTFGASRERVSKSPGDGLRSGGIKNIAPRVALGGGANVHKGMANTPVEGTKVFKGMAKTHVEGANVQKGMANIPDEGANLHGAVGDLLDEGSNVSVADANIPSRGAHVPENINSVIEAGKIAPGGGIETEASDNVPGGAPVVSRKGTSVQVTGTTVHGQVVNTSSEDITSRKAVRTSEDSNNSRIDNIKSGNYVPETNAETVRNSVKKVINAPGGDYIPEKVIPQNLKDQEGDAKSKLGESSQGGKLKQQQKARTLAEQVTDPKENIPRGHSVPKSEPFRTPVSTLKSLKITNMSNTDLLSAISRLLSHVDIRCHRIHNYTGLFGGVWFLCDDPGVSIEPPCQMYSFSVQADLALDATVAEERKCTVTSNDPNLESAKGLNRSAPITSAANQNVHHPRTFTSQDFEAELGRNRTSLDVIKMDVEGLEWGAIPRLIASGQLTGVRQLVVQFHVYNTRRGHLIRKLRCIRALEKAGFRKFVSRFRDCQQFMNESYFDSKCYDVGFLRI